MEQVQLGTAGLKVSRLCLGMMSFGDPSWRDWVLTEEQGAPIIEAAVEAGITFFDTADVYSEGVSEEVTGRALRRYFARREEYVVATKVFQKMSEAPNDGGLSRGHILDSVDASLRRLGTDHIDLFQIHRFDPTVPVEETMQALHDCVRAGKVRYLGASSMYAWQFAKLQYVAVQNGWTPFVTMQNQYNLLYREEEREMIPQCLDMGIGLLPWSPLARGALARPAAEGTTTVRSGSDHLLQPILEDANHTIIDVVGEVADALDASRAAVALAWVLQRPGVTAPIIGTTKPAHLADALAALEVELPPEGVERLESAYTPRPVII